MTVDLGLCTGCGACAIACVAENNLPVVGKEGVRNAREMHWLRIDRYLTGVPEDPHVVHQPMLCQHCEKAPCEYVCPVNATVHSSDGLNEMIYNRCVGTRFCSNNCPYKVRRFNWFDYNEARSDLESLVLNPEVTARERGVMEKCTYCVQRIRGRPDRGRGRGAAAARWRGRHRVPAGLPDRGDHLRLVHPQGEQVSKSRVQERIYDVLHELGTEPRTKYLAKITNPNPELHREPPAAATHPSRLEAPPLPDRAPREPTRIAALGGNEAERTLSASIEIRKPALWGKAGDEELTRQTAPPDLGPDHPRLVGDVPALLRRRRPAGRSASPTPSPSASAPGATTSRSPGRTRSSTSSGGSGSATPGPSSPPSCCCSSRSGAPRSIASPRR